MKVIEMANAVIAVDKIIYATRTGECISVYLQGGHTVTARFRNATDADLGLKELYAKMAEIGG